MIRKDRFILHHGYVNNTKHLVVVSSLGLGVTVLVAVIKFPLARAVSYRYAIVVVVTIIIIIISCVLLGPLQPIRQCQ